MLRNKESEQLIIINKTMKQCHGRKATTKLKKIIRHKAHMCIEKKKKKKKDQSPNFSVKAISLSMLARCLLEEFVFVMRSKYWRIL